MLVESPEAGVHLAVSPDQLRIVFFQGHPEYHILSLLKEYKREVLHYLAGELNSPPPFPEHYFSAEAASIAGQFLERAKQAHAKGETLPGFSEEDLDPLLDNTWGDTAKAMVNNWLGLVYKFTNLDRKKQFMEEVDPGNPFDIQL